MSILTDPGKAQATAYSPISMTSSLLINLFRRFANLAHTVCHNCDMIRFLWIWECLFWSGTMLTPSHQLIIVVKSSIIALPLGQLYKKMIWWPKKRTFFLTTSHGQTRIWQAKRLCNHPKCRSWSNKGVCHRDKYWKNVHFLDPFPSEKKRNGLEQTRESW